MPDTGLKASPKLVKGALVQLVEQLSAVVPNVVVFQYNPEKLSHTVTPWNPTEVDETQRGSQTPNVQPFDPKESFSLSVELDAADGLEDDKAVAKGVGIADRLAALQKLTQASSGLVGDLVGSAASLFGEEISALRPTVPVVLFVWGPGRILPVRVTSYSVEETAFLPSLYPLRATVSLGLQVLTPDMFKCNTEVTSKMAIAAYKFTKLQQDGLAVANVANNIDEIKGLLPF